MRIASADHRLPPLSCKGSRRDIRTVEHVAVQCLDGWKVIRKQRIIPMVPPAGQARESVIDAEKELLAMKVCDQRVEIVAASLQVVMLPFCKAIYAHVNRGAVRHRGRDLFAQEKVRLGSQNLGGIDRIMIGDGHQVHTAGLQRLVYFPGLTVTFPTNTV